MESFECQVGFSLSTRPFQLAGVLTHIIGPLFLLVLTVTVGAEYAALKHRHRKRCQKKHVVDGKVIEGHKKGR